MKNTLLILIALVYCVYTFAQDTLQYEWFRSYSFQDSIINSATAVDANGYAYVTGFAFAFATSNDVVTAKYDQQGNLIWVKTFNGPGNHVDVGKGIIIGENGNIYVLAAISISTGYRDYALLKYSPDGTLLWVVTYDNGLNDNPNDIAIDHNGKICITGESETTPQNFDYATIKYDTNGTMLWIQRYDNINLGDGARAIVIDGNNNILVTGGSVGVNNKSDFATVKYDNNGNLIWVARTDGIANDIDMALDIAIDNFNNIYVCGWSMGIGTYSDFLTVKYTSNGNEEWNKRYTGTATINKDQALSLVVNNFGELYVAGVSYEPSTAGDYTTIKYNSIGQEEWIQHWDGIGSGYNDNPSKIVKDANDNLYITGSSFNGTNNDFATIKYNSSGALQWIARFNDPADGEDRAHDLAVNSAMDVFVVGQSFNGSNFDFTTIKYKQPTPLTLSVITKNATCNGFTDGVIDLTVTGGVLPNTYQWSNGATTQDIDSLIADTFYVTVTDNAGSSVIDTVEITEPAPDNSSALSVMNDPFGCTDLLFSEYLEGTSKNRALEMTNMSDECADLSHYSIKIWKNGFTNPDIVPLNGIVPPKKSFTCGHTQADPKIKGKCDMLCSCLSFDGDDAIGLYKRDTLIDIIGEIGTSPGGTGWQVGTGFTRDYTLRRKYDIRNGTPYWVTNQLQWNVRSIDDETGLKEHKSLCTASIFVDFLLSKSDVNENKGIVDIYLRIKGVDSSSISCRTVVVNYDNSGLTCKKTTNPDPNPPNPFDPPADCIDDFTIFGHPKLILPNFSDTCKATLTVLDTVIPLCSPFDFIFRPFYEGISRFSVKIINDTINDPNESVCFYLDQPSSGLQIFGNIFHLLNIVDNDPLTSLVEIPKFKDFTLLQAIVTKSLNIAGLTSDCSLLIHSILGQVVLKYQLSEMENLSIDISNLPDGLYFCQFNFSNHTITKKFIKQ